MYSKNVCVFGRFLMVLRRGSIMKKILSLCALMALFANSVQYSVVLAGRSDSDIELTFDDSDDLSEDSQSYSDNEIQPSQRYFPTRGKKEKKEKKSDKSGKGDKSGGIAGLFDTAQQGVDFVIGHKDEIIGGAQKASGVVDSLIGNKDGKLTPDEVINFLKGLGGKLIEVKNLLTGILKKKDDKQTSLSDATPKRITRAAVHIPILSDLVPKATSFNVIKERLGDKLDDAKALLTNVKQQLEAFPVRASEAVQQFIVEHETLYDMVSKLLDALDKDHTEVRGGFLEVANFFTFIGQLVDKVEQLENAFYVDVREAISNMSAQEREQLEQEFGGDDGEKQLNRGVTRGNFNVIEIVESHKDSVVSGIQHAGAMFEKIIGYEDGDGKLTPADLPKILTVIKEKIGKLQGLLGKIGKSKRGIGGADDAVLMQVKAYILEVGKNLSKLAQIFQVPEAEIKKIYSKMNIPQISNFIENGSEENEELALANQLATYENMLKTNRAPINTQTLGECLQTTLTFVSQLQTIIPVADAIAQQAEITTFGRITSKINWKKTGVYLGVLASLLGTTLTLGEQQGWWDIYPS